MSVEKRPGSPFWYARFQIGGKRYFLSTGARDKKAALTFERAERDRIKAQSEQDKRIAGAPMTIALAMGRYWQESGQYQKGHDVLRHLTWLQERLGANLPIGAVSTREIAAIVAQRRADGVSNATVNRSVIEPLRRVFNRARRLWSEKLNEIDWPALKLKEPKERVREASPDEERAMLAAVRDEYRAPVLFAILSGFRRAEVTRLRWRDIDWSNRTISVIGKGDKAEIVPMTSAMEEVLLPQRGHHFEFVFSYIKRRNRPGEPIKGARVPINPTTLYREMQAACAAANISGLRFHDLRHTAGSRITRAGGLRVAQQVLRHADIKTTVRYAHVLDDEARRAMEIANAASSPAVKTGTD